MWRVPALICWLLSVQMGLAEPRSISPQEFGERVRGKVLIFQNEGVDYGIEEYLRDNRVRWRFIGGECFEGRWWVEGPDVCFAYEGLPDIQCWQFSEAPGGMVARFTSQPTDNSEYFMRETDLAPQCPGPKIGV